MASNGLITKAVLLVGGKGTRLQPLTNQIPKPMLRIAGAPVTEHQILKAKRAGITEIVLSTSYLAEVFEPYFGDGSRFGVQIKYAVEEIPLGTGGAIRNGAKLLSLAADESFVILNGDVISGHNLQMQSEFHLSRGADVTLHLARVSDARRYGCVPVDENLRVIDFIEKMESPIADTINAGCYVFSRRVLDAIPDGVVTSIEREIFPKLLSVNSPIFGYIDESYWIDMGTPDALLHASRDLILQPSILGGATGSHQSLIEPGAEVDNSARIVDGSFIQSGAIIGSNVTVSGSIVAENAVIEANSVVEESYIAPKSRVISGSKIKGEIFGF